MNQGEFLSADEVRELTGYKHVKEQDEWLSTRAIPHRRDGKRVIVSRVHARAWLEGRPVVSSNGPNWNAVA